MAHVFISYVREDQALVDRLCDSLHAAGVDVWVDRTMIAPGQRWQQAIREAVEAGSFFIACFSGNYADRSRTYMNEELLLAVEELRKRSRDRAWFIPVLFSDCAIPDISIGPGETLRNIQWVDLQPDWDGGVHKLLAVLTRSPNERKSAPWITLLITDIVGSTALSEQLSVEELRIHQQAVMEIQRCAVRESGGVELASLGDSLMASFTSGNNAVTCALAIQERMRDYRELNAPWVQVRIVVHAGHGMVSEGRVYGEATHIAARICARADPDRVLISGSVEESLDKHQFALEPRRTAMLKGVGAPIGLFVVSGRLCKN